MLTNKECLMDDEKRYKQIINRLIDNYDDAKLRLSVRLKDKEVLKRMGPGKSPGDDVYTTEDRDFVAFYQLLLMRPETGREHPEYMVVHVSREMLAHWGVSLTRLRYDALRSWVSKPCLYSLRELADEIIGPEFAGRNSSEAKNLLCTVDLSPESYGLEDGPKDEIFVLTNQERYNGASLILLPKVLADVAAILGGDYFILPSSIHEVLIVPASLRPSIEELEETVRSVNQTIVGDHDFLSNKVQFYDAWLKNLFNADDYRKRKMAKQLGFSGNTERSDISESKCN